MAKDATVFSKVYQHTGEKLICKARFSLHEYTMHPVLCMCVCVCVCVRVRVRMGMVKHYLVYIYMCVYGSFSGKLVKTVT